MATLAEWLEGARIRTLPAAISPVLVGAAMAYYESDRLAIWPATLALIVALSLQIGCNYANDYSDGIRGTDDHRVGPLRLVGSGKANPKAVKYLAFAWLGMASLTGLILILLTQYWWLLVVGLACLLAAWYYTGGKHPYGYAGLGEVNVFIFFGLVAVCGTTYVMIGRITLPVFLLAIAMGCFAAAILVANNLRDIDTDLASGKRTLATFLGDYGTRLTYLVLLLWAWLMIMISAFHTSFWLLLGLLSILLLLRPIQLVLAKAKGKKLVLVLKITGLAQLLAATGLAIGCLLGN